MARRRYSNNDNSVWSFVTGLIGLYLFYLLSLYLTDRSAYWRQLAYFAVFVVVVVAGGFMWKSFKDRKQQKHLDDLLKSIEQLGLKEEVKHFVDRWGMQKGRRADWTYRGHGFEWDRLGDLRTILNDKGMRLPTDSWDDTLTILRYYIQEAEQSLTRESVKSIPQKYSNLSGPEFEQLAYRLFAAMGYAVQKTGRTGDQGGDLIANKDGQRIVIQAKCYSGSVGNKAVQEAISAQKYYDCNRAIVVTTSTFTKEAIDLAKVGGVELIGGAKLSELLIQNLKESWG